MNTIPIQTALKTYINSVLWAGVSEEGYQAGKMLVTVVVLGRIKSKRNRHIRCRITLFTSISKVLVICGLKKNTWLVAQIPAATLSVGVKVVAVKIS